MKTSLSKFLLIPLLAVPLGCGGSDDGGGAGTGVSLSLTVPPPAAPAALAAMAAGELTLTDGTHTLVITEAKLVLREIEFELADDDALGCDDDGATEDDCEEFELGPVLVDLPLDGSVATTLAANVAPGTYDELEFEVHKPSDDDAADAAFIAAHPDFADVSIRVIGTYDGVAFEYTTDLDAEQELEFAPPLEVIAGAPTNITLAIDLDQWFRAAGGTLIDPATANAGGANEGLVEDNIKTSIEGFEDEDEDGEDDDATDE